jgi:hypothetical protein
VADFPAESRALGEELVDGVLGTLVDATLQWLPGGLTAYVPDLIDGRTFLHRITASEIELGVLDASFDLGALARFDNVRLDSGSVIEQSSDGHEHLGWRGTDGWLAAFAPGSMLAVTVTVDAPDGGVLQPVDGVVTIVEHGSEPSVDDTVIDDTVIDNTVIDDTTVQTVRAGYDALVAEPGLPVSGEQLALWLLFHHPEMFNSQERSLSELCDAAGLEQRGGQVAHSEAIWRAELHHRRFHDMADMVPEVEWRLVLGNALRVLDDANATVDDVRAALDACAEPETLDVLTDIFFPHGLDLVRGQDFPLDDLDSPRRLVDLVNRATTVARRPRETATAEYLACVLHERCGAADIAEQHLVRAGDAQPRLGPVVERLGWYRFDRGDARGAMSWWRNLTELPPAAATLEPFVTRAAGTSKLGRNDPCWCGSGRKFKQCHLNSVDVPVLPDRVEWLYRKALLWVEHVAGDTRMIVTDMATARATGDARTDGEMLAALDQDEFNELFANALGDPIIFDAALHEGGLFALFLRERGALLPDDEQLLATVWLTVERRVHEVVAVDPGVGLTLRDLVTSDVIEARDRTISDDAKIGERYCARVVPDGNTHQIIGATFPVPAEHEAAVLELCEARDGIELCAWVGRLHSATPLTRSFGLD